MKRLEKHESFSMNNTVGEPRANPGLDEYTRVKVGVEMTWKIEKKFKQCFEKTFTDVSIDYLNMVLSDRRSGT